MIRADLTNIDVAIHEGMQLYTDVSRVGSGFTQDWDSRCIVGAWEQSRRSQSNIQAANADFELMRLLTLHNYQDGPFKVSA